MIKHRKRYSRVNIAMNIDLIKQLVTKEKEEGSPSGFYLRIFHYIAKQRREKNLKDPLKRVCQEGYEELSYRLDLSKIQESCSVRNVLRTRRLAQMLINKQGELDKEILSYLIKCFEENLYSLIPDRQYDGARQEQILFILRELQTNNKLVHLLKLISKPVGHRLTDQMIRDTLQLSPQTIITDIQAKQAALSALLCYLRQTVGSCFATAPAIIVHDEQPEQFLKDIYDLLTTGRLVRTYGGNEYAIPLSSSWGAGDLKKQFYLQRDLSNVEKGIWNSPGLINSLKVSELIDPKYPSKKKSQIAKRLVAEVIKNWEGSGDICVVTVEKLLRRILLRHFEITEKDIQDYSNRPVGLIQSSLLMHTIKSPTERRDKDKAISQFISIFDLAKNSFKSLADNALLKAWEFTLASFVDTQATLSSWNLYSSLGLRPDDEGGIGPCLYELIKEKLDEANAKVAEYQSEYEQLYVQIKYLESRIKSASTEKEVQWIKVEYQGKLNEFHLLEELRNKSHAKASAFSSLFDTLVDLYFHMIPKYFQEVYDAEMQDVPAGGQYDDSPAGFRLLYKYGRSNTSQWALIYSPQEYIQVLTSFFVTTENEISFDPRLEDLREELGEIVTRIVNHIVTPEFIKTAFYRIAKAHRVSAIQDPLENLDRIEKKPWAYTSGGSMDNLLSCYYRREQKPTVVSRWVESETELLVFLLDVLKQVPYKAQEEFIKNKKKSILMHSPTHAFLLKPSLNPFVNGWQTDEFTYVWVRDKLILPMKEFIEDLSLNEQMARIIIEHLMEKIPQDYRQLILKTFQGLPTRAMSSLEFHEYMIEAIHHHRKLRSLYPWMITREDVDSALFSLLPFFPGHQLETKLEKIFDILPGITSEIKENALEIYRKVFQEEMVGEIISAIKLQNLCKLLLAIVLQTTTTKMDYHLHINDVMRSLGFAIPTPIIFADTNWVKDLFGFVVNPGTGKLEFWRMDYAGNNAVPMNMWDQWLNGSRRDLKWGVYSRPYEYTNA